LAIGDRSAPGRGSIAILRTTLQQQRLGFAQLGLRPCHPAIVAGAFEAIPRGSVCGDRLGEVVGVALTPADGDVGETQVVLRLRPKKRYAFSGELFQSLPIGIDRFEAGGTLFPCSECPEGRAQVVLAPRPVKQRPVSGVDRQRLAKHACGRLESGRVAHQPAGCRAVESNRMEDLRDIVGAHRRRR